MSSRSDGIAIDSLGLSGDLNGPQLDLKSTAKLRDFGNFSGEAKAALSGSLADPRTLQRVTGELTVKAEHVPFGLLSYALPRSAGISEVRGEGSATLVLDRQEPNAKAQIVVISGLPDAWKRAQATDARAILLKPFDMDAFLTLVHHLA